MFRRAGKEGGKKTGYTTHMNTYITKFYRRAKQKTRPALRSQRRADAFAAHTFMLAELERAGDEQEIVYHGLHIYSGPELLRLGKQEHNSVEKFYTTPVPLATGTLGYLFP